MAKFFIVHFVSSGKKRKNYFGFGANGDAEFDSSLLDVLPMCSLLFSATIASLDWRRFTIVGAKEASFSAAREFVLVTVVLTSDDVTRNTEKTRFRQSQA